jgi:hypothetical protein
VKRQAIYFTEHYLTGHGAQLAMVLKVLHWRAYFSLNVCFGVQKRTGTTRQRRQIGLARIPHTSEMHGEPYSAQVWCPIMYELESSAREVESGLAAAAG